MLAPAAMDEMTRSGILASLTIAQGILESAWGASRLSRAPHYNLFGVKASQADIAAGRSVNLQTTEYRGGAPFVENHHFRTYKDHGESIRDHSRVLLLPRYKKLIGETDYVAACYAVQKAGYATDPNYALLLINVIRTYKLYDIDKEVLRVNKPDDWKTKIMQEALEKGLITEDHKPDDPAPKWFVCAVALNTVKEWEGGLK